MSRIGTLFFAVILLGLWPRQSQADNVIHFDKGMPGSPAPGIVNGTGSYAIDLDAGWQADGVVMYAVNVKGGLGGQANCFVDPVTNAWTGTITGLPGGTYAIHIFLTVKKGRRTLLFCTPTKMVKIAAP